MLGLAFVIVLGSAYVLLDRAQAPSHADTEVSEAYESNRNGMMKLTSPVFAEGGSIPSRYTCEGENVHPELHIAGVPSGATSLALIVEDPDIPASVKESRGIEVFDHWVVFNMPADTAMIEERQAPAGIEAMNSAGPGYTGPCPPDGEHRYIFTLYALDTVLQLNSGATKEDVQSAMAGHVLEKTTLTGVYEKHN